MTLFLLLYACLLPPPTALKNAVSVGSSALKHLTYHGTQERLDVEFRDGSIYQYSAVPLRVYHDLMGAESKGAFFNRHIRTRFAEQMVRSRLG